MFLDRLQHSPINFGQLGPIGVADIVVDDSVVYQQMVCHVLFFCLGANLLQLRMDLERR